MDRRDSDTGYDWNAVTNASTAMKMPQQAARNMSFGGMHPQPYPFPFPLPIGGCQIRAGGGVRSHSTRKGDRFTSVQSFSEVIGYQGAEDRRGVRVASKIRALPGPHGEEVASLGLLGHAGEAFHEEPVRRQSAERPQNDRVFGAEPVWARE
jgi:hypothetical protein